MAARGEQHDRGHEEQSKGWLGAGAVEKDSGKSEVLKERRMEDNDLERQ